MTKNYVDWMMAARADYKLAQFIKKLISREHLLLLHTLVGIFQNNQQNPFSTSTPRFIKNLSSILNLSAGNPIYKTSVSDPDPDGSRF